MSVIVAGSMWVPPEKAEGFRPHMATMMAATQGEAGCLDFSYALDAVDPSRIRVFGIWRDADALKAHQGMPHIAEWRSHWAEFGVSDRRLIAYETAGERPL